MSKRQDGTLGDPARPMPARKASTPLADAVGRTRYIVLIGVIAVLLIAVALFVLGAVQAVSSIWGALLRAQQGQIAATDLAVDFLEIVSIMLKAVVFYLVGVGFYSLFIAPLNLPTTLGVETLNDLESKIVSVVIVIMAITFLEHFIQWNQPGETMQFGATMALVIAALVLFQFHSHWSKEEHVKNTPAIERSAQHELFESGEEKRRLDLERTMGPRGQPDGES